MQYYMLDKNDRSEVRGVVSAKDIIKELGITNAQFTKMVRNEEVYNGCILVPVIRESGRELPTSESEELYQLVGESDSGYRYYVTSHIRVVSVSPFDGVEREMCIRKSSETRYVVKIIDGKRKKYISVLGDEKSQKDTITGLKSAEGYIRRQLARTVNLRNTPEIRFILDQSIEYGINMSKLIDEVTEHDNKMHVEVEDETE